METTEEQEDKKQLLRKYFSRSWTYNWRELHKKNAFTVNEEGVLHRLQAYINFQDNTIRDFKNGIPMQIEGIAKLIGKSVKQTKRIIESLKAKNAILEQVNGTVKSYVLNPALFWKGTEKDKEYQETLELFVKELKNIRCFYFCPFLANPHGRRIPVFCWDGQKCPKKRHLCPSIDGCKKAKEYFSLAKKDKTARKKQARESGLENQ